MERERRFLTCVQGRGEQGYLRIMAMEIRWENKTIEVSTETPPLWEWTRLSEGTFRVTIHGKCYKVEAIDGPDALGNMTVRVAGIEREVKYLTKELCC